MKKIVLLVFTLAMLLGACTSFGGESAWDEEKSQPLFQRIENIPEGKCVVYQYRLPAFAGSQAVYNTRVIEAGEDFFPTHDGKAYAYLLQGGYVPIVLDAGQLYRIGGAGFLYFRGEAGTEVLLGVKGQDWGFECLSGSCEAFITHGGFSRKKEAALITTGEYLETYSAVSSSERLEEIAQTRLASVLKPHIQTP